MKHLEGTTEKQTIPCPGCGGAAFNVTLEHCKDYMTGDAFVVESCNSCNLARTSPVPESLNRYYPDEYRSYASPILLILKTFYRFRVNRWTELFKHPGSVLEVGCGQGFMLSILKESGWKVYGIERNKQAARIASEITGSHIFVNGFSEVPDGAQYDLIILFQVLEHIDDPVSILVQCTKHLAPKGRLIIGVPNFGSWQAKFAGDRWFHLDPPRHLFHFNPITLQKLLLRSGLTTDSISYVSWEHDPYGWLQSFLNRAGFQYNRLTKLLMGVHSYKVTDVIFIPLILILGPVSILVAVASWIVSQGALMTVVANKTEPEEGASSST